LADPPQAPQGSEEPRDPTEYRFGDLNPQIGSKITKPRWNRTFTSQRNTQKLMENAFFTPDAFAGVDGKFKGVVLKVLTPQEQTDDSPIGAWATLMATLGVKSTQRPIVIAKILETHPGPMPNVRGPDAKGLDIMAMECFSDTFIGEHEDTPPPVVDEIVWLRYGNIDTMSDPIYVGPVFGNSTTAGAGGGGAGQQNGSGYFNCGGAGTYNANPPTGDTLPATTAAAPPPPPEVQSGAEQTAATPTPIPPTTPWTTIKASHVASTVAMSQGVTTASGVKVTGEKIKQNATALAACLNTIADVIGSAFNAKVSMDGHQLGSTSATTGTVSELHSTGIGVDIDLWMGGNRMSRQQLHSALVYMRKISILPGTGVGLGYSGEIRPPAEEPLLAELKKHTRSASRPGAVTLTKSGITVYKQLLKKYGFDSKESGNRCHFDVRQVMGMASDTWCWMEIIPQTGGKSSPYYFKIMGNSYIDMLPFEPTVSNVQLPAGGGDGEYSGKMFSEYLDAQERSYWTGWVEQSKG